MSSIASKLRRLVAAKYVLRNGGDVTTLESDDDEVVEFIFQHDIFGLSEEDYAAWEDRYVRPIVEAKRLGRNAPGGEA